jgi:CheY-like chemotaxis protein
MRAFPYATAQIHLPAMIEMDSVNAFNEHAEWLQRAASLPDLFVEPRAVDANRASARSKRRVAVSSRPGKRGRSSRALPLSVLVVDDVADVTEMIALFLKHAGYDVTTADSAASALRIADEKRFDVIISDIGMPEMNGYELAERLRGSTRYEGTPIIAVTGYSEYDDRSRALQAGFNAHLIKPIDPDRLLNLIKSLLGN